MNQSSSGDTADFEPAKETHARFFGAAPTPVRIDVGGLSHVGKVRDNNEDHFAVIRRRRSRIALLTNLPEGDLPDFHEDAYSLVVADGIGGAAFGELASRLALRAAGELGISEYKWPMRMNDQEAMEFFDKIEAYALLLQDEFVKQGKEDPQLKGMGTTLTAAYTTGCEAFIAHIGDSRAYLYRHGRMRQLTRDHTLAQEMIDAGMDDADESQLRWMNRVLTNSLSTRDQPVRADVMHLTLKNEDRLLLCSDGLSDLVMDEEIAAVLKSQTDSQEACQSLVDLALERGGKDNITVIVASYEMDDNEIVRDES